MTTAFDLYDAAFDSACEHQEETIQYLQEYADAVFNVYVSDEICQKIIDCKQEHKKYLENCHAASSNDFDYMVRFPLQEIIID